MDMSLEKRWNGSNLPRKIAKTRGALCMTCMGEKGACAGHRDDCPYSGAPTQEENE